MKKARKDLTKEILQNEYKIVEIDGKYYFNKPRAGLCEVPIQTITKNHKYGKALTYNFVALYSYETHKSTLMTYHKFLYAWHFGLVPAGYDVDHKDDDTLNNSLDNLQLLTHAENIKKRGGGKNQFTAAKERGI